MKKYYPKNVKKKFCWIKSSFNGRPHLSHKKRKERKLSVHDIKTYAHIVSIHTHTDQSSMCRLDVFKVDVPVKEREAISVEQFW